VTHRTGFPQPVLDRVLARSGGQCEAMLPHCTITATQFHHRRPRAMGGTRRPASNTASACLHLCLSCHRWIELHRGESLALGFLVLQTLEPLERPVWWRSARDPDGDALFVMLDDYGNRYTVPVRRPA
jgi:5-methylcytosine-specific restriction protein A